MVLLTGPMFYEQGCNAQDTNCFGGKSVVSIQYFHCTTCDGTVQHDAYAAARLHGDGDDRTDYAARNPSKPGTSAAPYQRTANSKHEWLSANWNIHIRQCISPI